MSKSKMNKLGLDNTVFKSKNGRMYDDTTEYGEFISTFDNWITLEEQKRNANYLANMERMHRKEAQEEDWQLTIVEYNVKRL